MLLVLGHIVTDTTQGALPALLPLLKEVHGLSYAEAGALVMTMNLTSSVIQPLFGHLTDRWNLRWLVPAGVALSGIGFSLIGLATGYVSILGAVVFCGLGVASFHPESFKAVLGSSGNRKVVGVSWFMVGGNLGMALGPILITVYCAWLGLKGVALFAVPGLLTAMLILAYWRRLARRADYSDAPAVKTPPLQPLRTRVRPLSILISAVVVLLTGLNVLGASIVGEAEEWIVGFKVLILLFFIGAGAWTIQPANLAPSAWSAPLPLLAGGMIIFLAYEGFELIANTAGDVRNPEKNLPKAYGTAVIFVIVLYILVSTVTVGNLSVGKIVEAKDYALAEAAKPFLGQTGFTLIAIAALLSTASAVNATLYGASRISYIIAKEGELPAALEKKMWNNPIEGLLIVAVLTLLVANLFDLSSISMMGSAGFLILFAAVNAANVRLRARTKSNAWIPVLGVVVCLLALAALIWQTARTHPANLLVLVVLGGAAFAIEGIYRAATGRSIKPSFPPTGSGEEGSAKGDND